MTENVEVLIAAGAIPSYAHPGDGGADLCSNESVTLLPGDRATVGTGVSLALPNGFVGFVVPRSGLASRHGITIVNSPGTVDAGYRGEIRVTLLNTDPKTSFTIEPGDRIAQFVVMPVSRVTFVAVHELPGSHRGAAGFGSTGIGSAARGAHPATDEDEEPTSD